MHRNAKFSAIIAAMLSVILGGCERNAAAPDPNTDTPATAANANANGTETPLVRAATDPTLQWGPCPSPFPTGCELTVLHGDPTKPNADVFLRVPGGYAIPAHSHRSAERMILVSGQLEVQYKGAAATTVKAGYYAFGPAGLPHRGTCAAGAACILFIAFEGPVDVEAYDGALD